METVQLTTNYSITRTLIFIAAAANASHLSTSTSAGGEEERAREQTGSILRRQSKNSSALQEEQQSSQTGLKSQSSSQRYAQCTEPLHPLQTPYQHQGYTQIQP